MSVNATLTAALAALLPTSVLLFASGLQFARRKSPAFLLQLIGTAALMIVVLAHLCEGTGVLPAMGWGREHSAGHYLDLTAALLAAVLFPVGYLLSALRAA